MNKETKLKKYTKNRLKSCIRFIGMVGILSGALQSGVTLQASSHMDAPLITFDDPANLADVYAFLTERDGQKYLSVGLSAYPFEEPGIGPNKYNFDPNVLYQIHLSLGDDVATGADSISYQFQFETNYKNEGTILQSYVGVVAEVDDASQNLTQTYTVKRVDHGSGDAVTDLGGGVVPPNNQGIATPHYNVDSMGTNPARPGVDSESALDRYTMASISTLSDGYRSFAGQREDGFYGDIQAIFDLLSLRSGSDVFDSQSGFNTHVIMLEIPVSELGGDMQSVGVHATTSRPKTDPLDLEGASVIVVDGEEWVQVGRLGNPLFCEALVAIEDKDLYNRTKPTVDADNFIQYADTPELAALINALIFGDEVAPTTARADLVGIFIPDTIKVDLSTDAARLAGGKGLADDDGFSRLGIFGGDTLVSQISAGFGDGAVPGGWPNGRRFGDDVIDIAVTAVISDLRTDPLTIRSADGIDNVSANDSVYNKVFPYAATPHNGRNSKHNTSFVVQKSPRLINIATRGEVGTGDDILIGGFAVLGDAPVKVLLRGIGLSMVDQGLNSEDVLADPMITVWEGDQQILMNDNWKSDQEEAVMASGKAPTRDEEAAVVFDFEPGLYTVHLSGASGETGIGLFDAHVIE